jgi:RNA polymerase sigma-70 factor (ECF subfamily)
MPGRNGGPGAHGRSRHEPGQRHDPEELHRAIERAKGGDSDALRYLYGRYAGDLYRYVKTIVRDHHTAEDVTQQVFARLMTSITRYEQRTVPFWAWMLRVARNAAIDQMRSNRLVPCEEVHGTQVATEDVNHDRRRSLTEALESLPHDQRQVLFLRHVVGLSPAEIADRLDRSEGSIHGLHHRGRRALRDELSAAGSGPALAAADRVAC